MSLETMSALDTGGQRLGLETARNSKHQYATEPVKYYIQISKKTQLA